MNFETKYKEGQQVFLVVQGEGVYIPTIRHYDSCYNRYATNLSWYILPDSIVFETEEELEEYKKNNEIRIDRGCSEWGYSRHSDWGY